MAARRAEGPVERQVIYTGLDGDGHESIQELIDHDDWRHADDETWKPPPTVVYQREVIFIEPWVEVPTVVEDP